MNLRIIIVVNLVVSCIVLAIGGVTLATTYLGKDSVEPVICECTCSVEETTEPVVEPTEVEITEVTEATEAVEVTVATEPVEVESVDPTHLGKFKLTAYCACSTCCGKSDGITATGTVATAGRTIAVDPNVIPYGTEVIINGKTYVAEDCGGAIKSNRIDIYFDTHSEALQFGVQYADVYLANK